MTSGIYAVLDLIAGQIIGGLWLHRHEAAAIRMFSDVAGDPQSFIAKHPADFNLVRLGYLSEDHELVPEFTTVLTGATWLAAAGAAAAPQHAKLERVG